jgi:FkbM family methyltransferase
MVNRYNLTMPTYNYSPLPARQAPFLYRVSKRLDRKGLRGGTRLAKLLDSMGALERPAEFQLERGLKITVPLARSRYDQVDIDTYDHDLMAHLAGAIQTLTAPVTLYDVGADIGLFSLKLAAKSPAISDIHAFEPNGDGFPWLKRNLAALPASIRGTAYQTALADYEGHGQLEAPDPRFTPGMEANHTQFFLRPAPGGPIPVSRLDTCAAGSTTRSVVIKIDVEGGELAVLQGAQRTIANSAQVIVVLEAHPAVIERTGVDAVECLRFLESIRQFRFQVGETSAELTAASPVFRQINPDRVYNLIATSL